MVVGWKVMVYSMLTLYLSVIITPRMPFKPVPMPKCPACDKSVYAAEEKLAGGQKWHTGCFKCSMCNKMLDSTNNNAKDNVLYCKVKPSKYHFSYHKSRP